MIPTHNTNCLLVAAATSRACSFCTVHAAIDARVQHRAVRSGRARAFNLIDAHITRRDAAVRGPANHADTFLATWARNFVVHTQVQKPHPRKSQAVQCPSGQESIAVEGWSADGCVSSGNVCVANVDGNCPAGAHCARLHTGVFGCKDGAEEPAGCAHGEQPISVVGWDHDGCITSNNVCVAQVSSGKCPAGAYCSLLDTGVYGCVASSKH
ncbi:hypothetical protein PsorP6_015278 [Peronosclerospora sorghi]|uniref:Uncharacterized protein n=1 Tax=Peronosclerospora sorghi TaxID=230839 RepID=A0ACC0VTG9_9STRA|nr:hypothetical protein PsorP6_015278 [Peronosclerospora sorghi]